MTDLGSFGGTDSKATGINASGQVIGFSLTPGSNTHTAFFWSGGAPVSLGTLDGISSIPAAINDAGQVVGYTLDDSGGAESAFLYSKGVTTYLGTLGGTWSVASGINSSGQVVGYSQTASGNIDAFLYSNGAMIDLGTSAVHSASLTASTPPYRSWVLRIRRASSATRSFTRAV